MLVKRAKDYFYANYRIKTVSITSVNHKSFIYLFTSYKKGSN